MYRSSSLNLWAVESGATKLDVDAHDDRIDFQTTGGQSLKLHPAVHLVSAGGDIADVAASIHTHTAAIASAEAGAAAASALVQSNLDAYETANNAAVASLNATVVSNKAISDANHASDAAARATLQNDLEAKVSDEETRANAAEGVLTAAVAQEVADRAAAVSAEATARTSADTALAAEVAVERGRIDTILAGAGVDLDTLRKLTDAYSNVDTSILNQMADVVMSVNDLITRVNELTGSTDPLHVLSLDAVVGNLDLDGGEAWLEQEFSLSYDMTDMWSSASSGMLGWPVYRAVVIASSGGALTGASTDDEVRAWLKASLDTVYGASVLAGSTLDDYRLKYADFGHYRLETGLPVGSYPYFLGAEQKSLDEVDWRLSYHSTAGDSATIYSTILSGRSQGKVLTISPQVGVKGVEFPVSGVAGSRDGYVNTIGQFSLK